MMEPDRGAITMLGMKAFVRSVGSPLKAETILMQHFANRRRLRFGWDRRYAEMEFGLHWDPIFHRHLEIGREGESRGPLP